MFQRLFSSRKFVLLCLALAGVFVLVGFGRVSWEQGTLFLTVTLPAWMLAQGFEDAHTKAALINAAAPSTPAPNQTQVVVQSPPPERIA